MNNIFRTIKEKIFDYITKHHGLFLVLLSFMVCVVYVFFFTKYSTYNWGSDAGGYWTRALERFNGEHHSVNQWVIWPPLYHIILSWLFYPIKFFGLWNYKLEAILTFQILLGSVSVYFYYRLLLAVLEKKTISLIATYLYIFTYPIVYLYAFIFSENIALPLFIISISLVFCYPEKKKHLLVAGLLFGVSIGVRPAFALFVIPLNFYIFAYKKESWSWVNAFVFGMAFVFIFALVSLESYRISNGVLKGPGSNGGLNFFLGQCKVSEVNSRFDGWHYIIGPPGYETYFGKNVFNTRVPIYDQDYFYKLGAECMKNREGVLLENFVKIKFLFLGTLFPKMLNAQGITYILPVFTIITLYTAILSFLFWPILWIRKFSRQKLKALFVFWSIPFMTFVMSYFFHSERRYIYSLIFVFYLLFFSIFTIDWRPLYISIKDKIRKVTSRGL